MSHATPNILSVDPSIHLYDDLLQDPLRTEVNQFLEVPTLAVRRDVRLGTKKLSLLV
jgi:hypothetical protein